MLRPFVHLNLAVAANGCVAAEDGHQVSISCAADWRRVHLLRESYDAVAVGARTWNRDQPRLNVRLEAVGREPARQPARVIFAGGSSCEVGPGAGRQTFVVGREAPGLHVQGPHVQHVPCSARDLAPALAALVARGVRSLLVEGGPTLHSSFLEQGLYDRLTIYVATENPAAALVAARQVLATLPALFAEPLGRGSLLVSAAVRSRVRSPQAEVELRASLPPGRLLYLDPDACGVANGGHLGERLALMGPVPLPLQFEGSARPFSWYLFGRVAAGQEAPDGALANSVLVYGEPEAEETALVRLHSGCHTGDLFGSMRCDCGPQLERALLAIVAAGAGVALYLTDHEGRGIGLWAKAQAYLLQDAGLDTYEANRRLGLPEDSRSYHDAAVVLSALLPGRRLRLLSNNPAKRDALVRSGFEVVEMKGLLAGHNAINRPYLEAKARRGHRLSKPAPANLNPLSLPKSLG